MAKFRKKPVVIEAIQWTGNNLEEVRKFGDDAIGIWWFNHGTLQIKTLEGNMTASPNDWIIRGIEGECYPCKPSIFEATYEPMEE